MEQFSYSPEVVNKRNLKKKKGFIIAGMGGSALAGSLLKCALPELDITVHKNYGLPALPAKELKNKLFIASSYSGNTEEVLDAIAAAKKAKLAIAVVATGGKLLKFAIENKLPYVELPDYGIQPRMALGLSAKALLCLMGQNSALKKISELVSLDPGRSEKDGQSLAQKLLNHIPVVYSSERNSAVAYTWKLKFNETGKVPAFYNVFPELNHNEMIGFDGMGGAKELSQMFAFVFLRDKKDNPRVKRRMEVMEDLLKEKGLQFEVVDLDGKNDFERVFSSFALVDWAAYYLAYRYGSDPEAVPMVEQFKKLL